MRISDWSSDVCSSDRAFDESAARTPALRMRDDFLGMLRLAARPLVLLFVLSAMLYVLIEQSIGTWLPTFNNEVLRLPNAMSVQMASAFEIGRASCRERVWQYV